MISNLSPFFSLVWLLGGAPACATPAPPEPLSPPITSTSPEPVDPHPPAPSTDGSIEAIEITVMDFQLFHPDSRSRSLLRYNIIYSEYSLTSMN